jgi:heat shock protein HslJ
MIDTPLLTSLLADPADHCRHAVRKSVRRRRVLGAALVGSVLLIGCGDDSSSDDSGTAPTAADLDGRTFLSTAVEGKTLVEDTQVSLTFTDASVAAIAGCNTMTGGYTIADDSLSMDALAQTMMACDAETATQDQWVSELLQGDPSITLDGDVLTLADGDVTLTLGDRKSVAKDNALDGGSWALESIDDAGVVTPAPESAFIAVSNGRLYVATGCNRGSGDVTVSGDDTVDIGPIALTRMACGTPVNEWETAVTAFLTGTLTFAVDGTDVSLTNGAQTLTMHEVPWTP